MYSEIKDSQRILINRLAPQDVILLEGIVERSKQADIELEALNGDTGDFSGVMVHVKPRKDKRFVINTPIPTEITINPNEVYRLAFDIDQEDVEILIKQYNYDGIEVTSDMNVLDVFTYGVSENTVRYSIRKEGYAPLEGVLTIHSVLRESIKVDITSNVEGAIVVVNDGSGTKIKPKEVTGLTTTFILGVDTYRVEVKADGYIAIEDKLELTEDNMLYPSWEIESTLYPIDGLNDEEVVEDELTTGDEVVDTEEVVVDKDEEAVDNEYNS